MEGGVARILRRQEAAGGHGQPPQGLNLARRPRNRHVASPAAGRDFSLHQIQRRHVFDAADATKRHRIVDGQIARGPTRNERPAPSHRLGPPRQNDQQVRAEQIMHQQQC